jgi:hypothetical protein
MTTRIIEAFECTCDKCSYTWSSITLPATCANKTCRSPRWNRPPIGSLAAPQEDLVVEKKFAVPSEDKKETISDLQKLMNSIKEKPKSDYHTKSILPEWKPPADQPDYYDSERSVNYD